MTDRGISNHGLPIVFSSEQTAEIARLTDLLAEARRERDDYHKAKDENDDRFLRERDDAREDAARLRVMVDELTAQRDRLQRACDQGLPREYIECPRCGQPHVEGPRFGNPNIDGRTRPHRTHRCYHCTHVWDSGRWSFGVDVPKPAEAGGAMQKKEADRSMADLLGQVSQLTAERDRLQRVCDQALPREYIECPLCQKAHVDGANGIEFATRPHRTHLCQHCGHVWDSGRWSFGADLPKPETLLRPVQVVAAVAVSGDKVLLVRAKHGLATPGGKVRAGETHEEALRREVRSEVGLNIVRFGRYLHSDVQEGYQCHLYAVDVEPGEPVAGDDATAAWWGDPKELLEPQRGSVAGYSAARDYPLVLDVMQCGVGTRPTANKNWHEHAIDLARAEEARASELRLEVAGSAAKEAAGLSATMARCDMLRLCRRACEAIGFQVGCESMAGSDLIRRVHKSIDDGLIAAGLPTCACPVYGPGKGCDCIAKTYGQPLQSDDWCSCECHRRP